jgi:hypothetical protein
MFCVNQYNSLKRWFRSVIYPTPVLSNLIELKYTSHSPVDWELIVPSGIVIIQTVRYDTRDDSLVKKRVWYSGDHYKKMNLSDSSKFLHSKPQTPWLWIGGDVGNKMIDMTSTLEEYVAVGNTITPELLYHVNPAVLVWKILDVNTLFEIDFPTCGITIDAAGVEEPSEKVKET